PPPIETKKDEWEAPLAGYNGAFYIRSKDDLFQQFINGRFQFDFVKPMGMGLYNSGIYSGFTVRRMRLEYGGCFGQFCYSLQPEYGGSQVNGNAPNATAPAGLTGAQS